MKLVALNMGTDSTKAHDYRFGRNDVRMGSAGNELAALLRSAWRIERLCCSAASLQTNYDAASSWRYSVRDYYDLDDVQVFWCL